MADAETAFPRSENAPECGRYYGFHHIELFVSNAKQVADWYCLRFGFEHIAYKGLETGSRQWASHAIRQGYAGGKAQMERGITLVFTSALNPASEENKVWREILASQGDSVRDVAFKCDNVDGIFTYAMEQGAKCVLEPTVVESPEGTVKMAKLQTYGKVVHTLINDDDYKGTFLPGFAAAEEICPIIKKMNSSIPVGLKFIDHIVGNQPDNEMMTAADWYHKHLNFHRFWSVDDKTLHTQYSSLRSIVMSDWHETVKMPINEPAAGNRVSQIQEYCNYHGGAGVQHIAMNTPDILTAIQALRDRGMQFLTIPACYYNDLKIRLAENNMDVKEDIDMIQKHNILCDFDDSGYLLQIFTKPVEDRPTLFFEIIQRAGNQGFGVGNFKALFESIERDQEKRGNLTVDEGMKGEN